MHYHLGAQCCGDLEDAADLMDRMTATLQRAIELVDAKCAGLDAQDAELLDQAKALIAAAGSRNAALHDGN